MADEVQLDALQPDNPAVADVGTAAAQDTVASEKTVTISEERLNDLIRAAVVAATAQQEEPEPSDSDDSPDQLDDTTPKLPEISSALASSIVKRLKEPMEAALLETKRERYVGVPSNLHSSLRETRVNKEVWSSMTIPSKKNDSK